MRSQRLVVLPVVGLVIVILVAFGFMLSSASANATNQQVKPSVQTARSYQKVAMQGAPALKPKNQDAIAFTASDIQAYVLAHGFMGGAVVSGHHMKILSVKLMTRQQADTMGAELEAYTDTTMVYVVKIQGPFYNTNVKSVVPSSTTTPTGYEIFDAHTGDMVEWGTPGW